MSEPVEKTTQQELLKQMVGLAKNSHYERALALCEKAMLVWPNDSQIFNFKIEVLYQSRQFESLIVTYEKNNEYFNGHTRLISIIANAYRYTNRATLAVSLLKTTIKRDVANQHNKNHFLCNQLGLIYKDTGNKSQAIKAFNDCLLYDSQFYEAYWNKLTCSATLSSRELQLLLSAVDNQQILSHNKVFLFYTLHNHFERLSDFDKAFNYLERGAALKRAQHKFDYRDECQQMRLIEERYTSHGDIERRQTERSQNESRQIETTSEKQASITPIFIVGMPRSGTSLVEQIISSHSLVTAGDETLHLDSAIDSVLKERDSKSYFPQWLSHLNDSDLQDISKRYFDLTQPLQITPYFSDKTLTNFKYVGLIFELFPNAKIIHCQRDPKDNIISCFRQLFTGGFPYSYDLGELKEVFSAYERLINHWKKSYGDNLLSVDYEALVDAPENQIEKILEYIGLSSEQACHQFYDNPRSVFTLSSIQVKQPIFNTSIGQWKNYSKQLKKAGISLYRSRSR
jgi:tetratricopeptide (TPR) repeat protein